IAERREASRQLERKMGLNGSSVAHLARQPRQKTELISASLGADGRVRPEADSRQLTNQALLRKSACLTVILLM
ncbi:hypothetical protein, partial [Janthinobacterium sp. LB3P112]|uniref:hypothetical protein n=1 Tax=Janthinobacterium sp. LB3P112 TaxID=3424196 RepID=UPI003F1E885B